MDEENDVLEYMLNRDESFGEEEGKTCVTQDEVIDKFYDAIFVNQYSGRTYNRMMGEYVFSKESKDFALSASSMMTHYADLS
jgi:hypothetical protein